MSSTLKKTELTNDNNLNENIIATVGYEINKLVDELIRHSRTQRSKIRLFLFFLIFQLISIYFNLIF